MAEVVRVAGKLPVNVLVGWPGFAKRELEDLGVKRISTGAALARAAWRGVMRAAKDIAEHGRFDAFGELPSSSEIEAGSWKAIKDDDRINAACEAGVMRLVGSEHSLINLTFRCLKQ